MEKLSLDKLRALREQKQMDIRARVASDTDIQVIVGMGTTGVSAGARSTLREFLAEVERRNLTNVVVRQGGDLGKYGIEPVVQIIVPGKETVTYRNVTPDHVATIVEEHIVNGRVVTDKVHDQNG
jgi:NADP-reducing hydrogenase subunit HndB